MQESLKLNVGAKTGLLSLMTPLARLKITEESMELNASLFGNLFFSSSDIISIKPDGKEFLWGNGFKVTHSVQGYPENIRFYSHKKPNELMNKIRNSGFLDKMNSEKPALNHEIKTKQESGRFPIKRNAALTLIILIMILLLHDLYAFTTNVEIHLPLSTGVFTALLILIFISVLLLLFGGFRKLILKKGRKLKDIDRLVYVLLVMAFIVLFSNLYLDNFYFSYWANP